MKLTNDFVQSKMNKDIDERLLPKGQYPHAENIRVSNSDGSDVGAIQTVKGNEALTSLVLTNAKTIGTFADGSNQKIYWFVTSDEKDLVMEYDVVNSATNVLLESSKPNGVLNFSRDYLITGVSKIINGDFKRDLLVWTDDLNPIRKINIERSKTYSVDGFNSDEISLIKKPPRFAPAATLTYTSAQIENAIEDSFYSFSYRYKYLDGEYSALSSYTNPKFAPEEFRLDYQTMENEGMVNSFNAVKLDFNTGDKTVTDIQLIVKETNSNALAIIETFNKSDEGWLDGETQSFVFANSKKYIYLPEKELYRPYDNVPRFAKAMEVINNRLIFGNYVEGYDLVNVFGEDIVVDYDLSLISKDLSGSPVPTTFITSSILNDAVVIDFSGKDLKSGSRVSFDIDLEEVTYDDGRYNNLFSFILNKPFTDVLELSEDLDFIYFVQELMTNHFLDDYTAVPPENSTILSTTGFSIISATSTTLTIKAPTITYRIDNTPTDPLDSDFTNVVSRWAYRSQTSAAYREIAVNSSLKTNRSYEVGIKYMDDYGRSSTVITDKNNTILIPQKFSVNQNIIVLNINNTAPVFADRYKIVVKQNKAEYQTIYTNIFYEDGLFRWVKLEGANKDKVKEGETLIVKSDLGGVVEDVIKVRILEVGTKEKDFIEGNKNIDGDDIIEEAGLYMKIKPTGFDMNFTSATARTFEGSSHLRYPGNTPTNPNFGEGDVSDSNFVPYKLSAGSSVRIYINFKARGSIAYEETYDRTFRVNGDYNSIEDWFNAEVVDLGSFGEDFTRGYGFTTQGEQFYVRAHRDGTASRSITTTVRFEVLFSEGTVIFETEPADVDNNIFYETEQTFEIIDGYHQGNIQNQSDVEGTAIIELDFFNCYAQGNGAESYRYKDAFNKKFLNIDSRPSSTSVEKFREIRRFADLTYSAPYNENTNVNGLNEFNLSTANYKEDIDKKYGFIQKLYAKDTDLVVFQEDKVSRVLYGKDLLMNTDGTSNLTSTESILGQQIPYTGEYGISRNPESFAFDANSIYFTDSKRGCVCRLGLNGITEISVAGMTNFFKEIYKGAIDTKKVGAYDPYYDQYVLHNSTDTVVSTFALDCSQVFLRNDFFGGAILNIDFGINIGQSGISYSSSNGVPVKYDLEYNGVTYTTGYVGSESYNEELISLGLPAVSGSGTGVLNFMKNQSIPRGAKVTITAPICGANFQVGGICLVPLDLTVVSLILCDTGDLDLSIKNRYRWFNDSYSSPFKLHDTVFGEEELELYDTVSGDEGTVPIPLTNSTVELQSYKGYSETGSFLEENRLGYWITNNYYPESSFQTILDNATFLPVTEILGTGGSVTNKIEFPFNRTVGQNYLYLVWDYRNEIISINRDTKIRIYFDSSGSMNSTLEPLQVMRDTVLKDRLIALYDGDSSLYDASVSVVNYSAERTLEMLNLQGDTPEGNVIVLIFQDEANPVYYGFGGIGTRTPTYNSDIVSLRNRVSAFPVGYYRGVVFQVSGDPVFKNLLQSIQLGTGSYSGAYGLSDKTEFNYKYDIAGGGTPSYYLDKIVEALTELGYEL